MNILAEPWRENEYLNRWYNEKKSEFFFTNFIYDVSKPEENPLIDPIAEYENINRENVYIGAGVAEFINSIIHLPYWNNIIMLEKEFGLYKFSTDISMYKEKCKKIDSINHEEIIDYFRDNESYPNDLFCISSPMWFNGEQLTKKTFNTILKYFKGTLLIDEVYIDYAKKEESLIDEIRENNDRVIILRSFSKSWYMQGLRVGYMITSKNMGDMFRKGSIGGHSVSSFSINFAVAVLKDKHIRSFFEKHRIFTQVLRKKIYDKLKNQDNIIISNSQANFGVILFKTDVNLDWIGELSNIVLIDDFKGMKGIKFPIWDIEEAEKLINYIKGIC